MKEKFPGQFHKVSNNDFTSDEELSHTVPEFIKVLYLTGKIGITTSNNAKPRLCVYNEEIKAYKNVLLGDYIVRFDPSYNQESGAYIIRKEVMNNLFDINPKSLI